METIKRHPTMTLIQVNQNEHNGLIFQYMKAMTTRMELQTGMQTLSYSMTKLQAALWKEIIIIPSLSACDLIISRKKMKKKKESNFNIHPLQSILVQKRHHIVTMHENILNTL